jgi:hypothetical protein
MEKLSKQQIETIAKYWEKRNSLDERIFDIEAEREMECIYSKHCDIAKFDKEIRKVQENIQALDEEYEEMLHGYGINLYDRNMDEQLFSFINDGIIE